MDLLLNQGELLDLGKNLRGMSVICHSGNCWLTQADDSRDLILRSGLEVKIHCKGQVILSAISPCRVQLVNDKAPVQLPALAGLQ